ncbi:hypothetical protein chmu122 [Choristoneura murinana nucleopolyhedrovirus]|uniref:Uncharacterized protein n=1 Tax=Choristoneura murinana nucleopolyhedrovirus TaxID=1987479 RepID=V9XVH6_9ABAC|nr:hypothetical protein chmu122 [Choristoneura murinana nucleopolyhedrovirus]AHD25608.1 hypothetical protein chmu122 [Choristoneura murinana nucleopolyhedrovirus]BBU37604.1 hypothetical protein [Choristoneura diversana nucleopolyhedrovirus]
MKTCTRCRVPVTWSNCRQAHKEATAATTNASRCMMRFNFVQRTRAFYTSDTRLFALLCN